MDWQVHSLYNYEEVSECCPDSYDVRLTREFIECFSDYMLTPLNKIMPLLFHMPL
jgi:hypothetical protein